MNAEIGYNIKVIESAWTISGKIRAILACPDGVINTGITLGANTGLKWSIVGHDPLSSGAGDLTLKSRFEENWYLYKLEGQGHNNLPAVGIMLKIEIPGEGSAD